MEEDFTDLCSGKEIEWTRMEEGRVYDVKPPGGARPFRGVYVDLVRGSDFNSLFQFQSEDDGRMIDVPVNSQFFLSSSSP